MSDLIRKSDALDAAHEADSLELQLHGATKIADRIATLPAVTVGVKPLTSETGHFARAAVDLVKTLQEYGLAVGVGQSDSDELDFCVTVYHGKELLGCASLHEDRTWSCYMTVGETVFKCESTPWHSLPEGMDAALAALTPTPVDDSQTVDPAIKALDDLARLGQEWDAAPDPAAIREAKPRIIPMHSQSMYGVCIGGRWDGWVMVKHPDGYWVSHNKPDPVDPSIPDFAAKGAADDRA